MPAFAFSTDRPTGLAVDVLVLPVFEGPEAGPGVKDVKGVDLLGQFSATGSKGKLGESLLVPTAGVEAPAATAVLLVGVGQKDAASPDTCRRAIGRVARQLARRKTVATTLPQIVRAKDQLEAIQATVEGVLLGSYRFDRYKSTSDGADRRLDRVTVFGVGKADARASREAKQAIRRGEVIAESQMWARDLVNTPALDLPPAELAREAQAMAKQVGLTSRVWTEAELKKGGFGGVLGVGQGSVRPPRLIELKYSGGGKGSPIALTGKGIAFDSGGLSIKDATGMEWMKADMGGAASILGTMRAIALLKPKINVIAAIPSAENMPSGSAIRPGDVLTHRGGTTSEVLNTDAEGRLVLADSLAFLAEKKPRVIIDTATLTGACMIALGTDVWGAMGNDRDLIRDVLAAGDAAGEPGWELPMHEPYRKLIDSDVADIKNIGKRYGGAITAAMFLREFVGNVPWVHLDIAGPSFAEHPGDYWPKGATGTPVRALVRYVLTKAGDAKA
ncbi:MAG TPA: leucyl aminopeptidase [Actinomycetota bacterium]|nr:leucyl aminopeptidase [Actinomycetota bacterium]